MPRLRVRACVSCVLRASYLCVFSSVNVTASDKCVCPPILMHDKATRAACVCVSACYVSVFCGSICGTPSDIYISPRVCVCDVLYACL